MNVFNNWVFFIILYLIASVIYNQCFKITTKTMKSDGAMTVLLNVLAAVFCLIMIPLFEWKITSDVFVYILLGIAIIFYTIKDRLTTTVMSGVDPSTFTILNQLNTAFMIILGFVFLKEPLVLCKIVGSILIIVSNVLIFYKKGSFKFDKYIVLGIIANLAYTIAMFIDVNNSDKLNLPLYVFVTLAIPAVLVFLAEKVKIGEIKEEFERAQKGPMFATIVSYALFILCSIRAYQLGEVTVVAPLISLSVIANVLIGYLFFEERDNLWKKILASVLILMGVLLIK